MATLISHLLDTHPNQRIYCTESEKLKRRKIVLGIASSIVAIEDVEFTGGSKEDGAFLA